MDSILLVFDVFQDLPPRFPSDANVLKLITYQTFGLKSACHPFNNLLSAFCVVHTHKTTLRGLIWKVLFYTFVMFTLVTLLQ